MYVRRQEDDLKILANIEKRAKNIFNDLTSFKMLVIVFSFGIKHQIIVPEKYRVIQVKYPYK